MKTTQNFLKVHKNQINQLKSKISKPIIVNNAQNSLKLPKIIINLDTYTELSKS